MKHILLFLVVALLLALFRPNQEALLVAGEPEPAATASDIQDIVFLGETRPFLIRLHIRLDGKPFREAWDDYMRSLFQYLDEDGDGVLSQKELEHAPKPQFLLQLLRGNLMETAMAMGNQRRSPEVQLTLVGGKVTREGLASYYRLSGIAPFLALTQDRSMQAERLTDALFKHLDLDGDGKLSKDELLAADSTLRKLDLDDDEMISIQEILPATESAMEGPSEPASKIESLSSASVFFLISAEESSSRLAHALLARYDKDKNEKLSRSEIALDNAVFDRLDQNRDGELDVQELARFHLQHPIDVELLVNMGGGAGPEGAVDVYNPYEHGLPGSRATIPRENKPLILTLGGARLELHSRDEAPVGFSSVRKFIVEQFQAVAADKAGSITDAQAQDNAYLKALFPLARKNQEGKLSLLELTAYVDLLEKAVASSTVLMITDHGKGLFDLLDTHHTGHLRQRDLKAAWARLVPWDRDRHGLISKENIPHQFHLLLSRGQPGSSLQIADGVVIPFAESERRTTVSGKGPLWFQRMDRNGDGYVSPREFLGTREDFQRIDTDGDGLISPEEAERADVWMRKKAAGAEIERSPSPEEPGTSKRD